MTGQERGNDLKLNLNRLAGGEKALAKMMKSMKKVRRVSIQHYRG